MRHLKGIGSFALHLALIAVTLLSVGLVTGVLPPQNAHAADRYIGTLTSTGASVNNTNTAVPFVLPDTGPAKLAVQCDAPAYIGASTTATSNNVKVQTDQLYDTDVYQGLISMVSVSGTANCKVYHRTP